MPGYGIAEQWQNLQPIASDDTESRLKQLEIRLKVQQNNLKTQAETFERMTKKQENDNSLAVAAVANVNGNNKKKKRGAPNGNKVLHRWLEVNIQNIFQLLIISSPSCRR